MNSVQLHPVGDNADLVLLHDLVRQTEVADRIPVVTTFDEVEEWAATSSEPARDLCTATLDGVPVGWGRVLHVPSGEVLERAYLSGAVLPAARRRGVGSAILSAGIERATDLLGAYDHELPRYMRVDLYDWIEDGHALCRAHGMTPVRWFEEMLRTLDDLPARSEPDGVQILPWDPSRGEEARQVRNASFADHWGTSVLTPSAWDEWMASHGARPDLSVMAVHDGELVGLSFNEHYPADEELTGRRDGWIQSIGVLRSWRGRGVASALIARSLEAFAGAGFTHAMLGVDADNPNGAAGLYRRLGFETQHRSTTFEREVMPSPR